MAQRHFYATRRVEGEAVSYRTTLPLPLILLARPSSIHKPVEWPAAARVLRIRIAQQLPFEPIRPVGADREFGTVRIPDDLELDLLDGLSVIEGDRVEREVELIVAA